MPGEPRATVAIAHTNEKHRSPERVEGLVREALDHLGGLSRFIQPGQTVLLKPNQTVFYSAEEGCTTDPLVVGALIRMAKAAGAAKVQVGESSGDCFSTLDCRHWLWKQWQSLLRMRSEGVPVLGFTWYSLTDQVDWDTELREANGTVNPLGLVDLDRRLRPVGEAYRDLVQEFDELSLLPHGDCLALG
jgi:Domain of unknown function (DUF362)